MTVNEDVVVRYSGCVGCYCSCGNRVKLDRETGSVLGVGGNPYNPADAYPFLDFEAPLTEAYQSLSYANGKGNQLRGTVCGRGNGTLDGYTQPDRITVPLKRAGKRGEGKWERITWDEALDIIEKKIRETIEEYGPQSVIISQGTGRGSNHFLDRLNNTWNGGGKVWPTHVCLLPNLAQTHVTYGRMFHPHEACDYRNAGSIVMWGTNPIRSRQYSGLRIMDAKRNGSRVVVVDPVFRDIAAKADLWVPVRPGTDGALALGLTNLMFQSGKFLAAEEMLTTWTNAPFLVDNEARMMMREADLVEGGSDEHYVVWDKTAGAPAIWRPETEDFDRADVKPSLMGAFEVTLKDGSTKTCKTGLETYKDEVAAWTPEKVSAVTWAPVEKILEMFDIITNPTDDKPSLLTAYLGACMMTSNALALDDFSTFTMKGVGNDVDPFELSCKQYNGLDAGTRRLVTAFLEGYAAEGSSTVFVPGAVKNFESGIMAVCAKNPGKALDGILEEVQYDVPDGGSEPRCSDLDGMTKTEDLAQLLLWTQGYLESELSENEEADQDQAIHQDTFREDVAEVLAQCKAGGSDAKLIDVMRKVIMGEE